MRRDLARFLVILVAAGSVPLAAQVQDLGHFKALETPPETGVFEFHYLKEGTTITAEALGAERQLVATVKLRWPGDQTARMHITTRQGRDLDVAWGILTGALELHDNHTGEHATLSFDAAAKAWKITGSRIAGETAAQFAEREKWLLLFVSGAYEDAVAHLHLRSEGAPSEQEGAGPGPTPPAVCRYYLCDGPHVVEGAIGLTRTSCCRNANLAADNSCAGLGGSSCLRCCLRTPCTTLCLLPGRLCSCTVEGISCGTLTFEPCEEWPPECT